jgi:hypothetical protein
MPPLAIGATATAIVAEDSGENHNLKGHLFLKTPHSPDPAARRIIVTPFYHTGMKGVDHRYHR